MVRFILKRLAATVLVLFAISVLVFLIFFATPGVDPAARIAAAAPARPCWLRCARRSA
jgi:peptide/nickel transport system permease protein